MKFDTERCSLVCEASNHFTCLSVPKLYYSVEASAQEPTTIISETNISYCLLMALVCSDALTVSHDIPNLYSTIVTGT